jgi:hypothetical protein
MYEAEHAVLLDELRTTAGAVLLQPNPEVIGDADVKRAVSAAGENVDVVGAGFAHRGHGSAKTFSTVVMGPGVRRDDVLFAFWLIRTN